MKEYQLQKAVCKYLDLNNILYCGSMGGQYQPHFSQRIKSRKSGYKKGFPDLFLYNKATNEQRWWRDQLRERGYYAEICTGIDEALEVINRYLEGKIE